MNPQVEVPDLPRTVWWEEDAGDGGPRVGLIDQRLLPSLYEIRYCRVLDDLCDAIATLALRGAPALGVGAAFACALWSEVESRDADLGSYLASLRAVARRVSAVRPTAVNLAWGAMQVVAHVERSIATMAPCQSPAREAEALARVKAGVVSLACRLRDDDEERCLAIGRNGAGLFDGFRGTGARVMTHCNAGSLATARYGTATGVIYAAFARDLVSHVWIRETRPVNQGARLTAWEMMRAKVPCSLLCDDAAAALMATGSVDAVVVGADRICANGDVANKVGTYELACLARMHGVPFYVAAPNSTIDPSCAAGTDVVVEQRDVRELAGFGATGGFSVGDPRREADLRTVLETGPCVLHSADGHEIVLEEDGEGLRARVWMRTTPQGVAIENPAFDVTPAELVTAIVTERGVYPPGDIISSLAVS